jgi:hypothetical protein
MTSSLRHPRNFIPRKQQTHDSPAIVDAHCAIGDSCRTQIANMRAASACSLLRRSEHRPVLFILPAPIALDKLHVPARAPRYSMRLGDDLTSGARMSARHACGLRRCPAASDQIATAPAFCFLRSRADPVR